MDATKLQEDYPIATPEYVMKLLNDYPVTTPEHVKELQKACPYVSLQDVVNCIINFCPHMATPMFDSSIHDINKSRENEELNGRVHVNAGPLLHVHSVHVKPKINKLAVYGRIRVCFQDIKSGKRMKLDLYKRRANDAERISSCGGNLTLSWPLNYPWTKLQGTTIVVKLYHKIGRKGVLFAKEDIFVGDATRGNFEELISKEFHYEVCCATLTYIAMPFAALCRVDVRLSGKEKGRVVNVAGKIVARFKNTYGNYDSEGCVLFEKQDGFEPVVMNNELCMSRAWLGLPAYSSLELDLDLRDYDTCRKIKRRVELLTGNGAHASEYAEAADDFAIVVDARLFPYPLIVQPGWRDYDAFEAICRPKFGFGTSTSISLNHRFSYKGQPSVQIPSRLAEFYSIFIGCKTKRALKIAGTVEFSSDNNTYYIFKSNGKDGEKVEDPQKVLPLKGVCMKFDLKGMLKLKVNLQDVSGKFANRGFANYDLGAPICTLPYNTQICSVFPGKDGFCALHYSFFPRACQASIEIILKIKSFHFGVDRIYGSAMAQYSNFDYSTEFKRDYFRSVLFRRTKKDAVQLKNDGKVPLSRNVIAVPMDSSLVIEVDFCGVSMKDHLFCNGRFEIGHCYFKEETNDYDLQIKLTWGDGLHNGWSELDEDKGCRMGGANQMSTSIKRKQPDQRTGGSDFDEYEDCRMGEVNQTNTSHFSDNPSS